MRVVACAIVGVCLAAPAAAATLHRCVGPEGAISYQDAPCDRGSLETRQIPIRAEPAPEVTNEKPAKRRPKDAKPKASTRRGTSARSSDARDRTRVACTQAREARDVALARAGLRRTFEQLRALDERVYEACKGL